MAAYAVTLRIGGALLVLLLTCSSAEAAATIAVEGYETQSNLIACSSSLSQVTISTSTFYSGNAAVILSHSGTTRGVCTVISGLALTGHTYFFTRLLIAASQTCGGSVNQNSIIDLGEVTVTDTCANGTNNHTFSLMENGAVLGSTFTPTEGVWYEIAVHVFPNGASSTAEWRISTDHANWTDLGGSTSRSISNVTQVVLSHPSIFTTSNLVNYVFDDTVLLNGTASWPTVRTFVNIRPASTTTPTYNEWSGSVGSRGGTGGSANIGTVWTSVVPVSAPSWGSGNPVSTCTGGTNAGGTCTASSECPSGVCRYAESSTTNDGASGTSDQTAVTSSWTSGTPTPVLDSTNVSNVWGCKWQSYSGRNTGTTRAYALRTRVAGTDNDTAVTFGSNQSWNLNTILFDITGSPVAIAVSNLNAFEVGGTKTTTASGAPLDILDSWVQCAWSENSVSTAQSWIQNE